MNYTNKRWNHDNEESNFYESFRPRLSTLEWDDLSNHSRRNQLKYFYSLWCLKESYLKGVGSGLGGPEYELNQIEFRFKEACDKSEDSKMNETSFSCHSIDFVLNQEIQSISFQTLHLQENEEGDQEQTIEFNNRKDDVNKAQEETEEEEVGKWKFQLIDLSHQFSVPYWLSIAYSPLIIEKDCNQEGKEETITEVEEYTSMIEEEDMNQINFMWVEDEQEFINFFLFPS